MHCDYIDSEVGNTGVLVSVSTVFACLGFLSPANRGALMTCALVCSPTIQK